jgi:uncharacterized protein
MSIRLTGSMTSAAVLCLALLAPLSAQAADPVRTITVSGEGQAMAAPNQAELSAGVAALAPTASAALAQNARSMTTVFAALKKLGVPDRSIQTSNFSVQPQYADNPRGNGTSRITGYLVSNQVDVTLDDTRKLGPALDALVAAGANQINSVGFSIKDQDDLKEKARKAAIADARKRAQTYVEAAGASLGAVITINENGSSMPVPLFRAMAVGAAPATPIATGELSMTANVTVTFELK